jgi:5-oxoprolinase (ATP-hydrolysing) subunit A
LFVHWRLLKAPRIDLNADVGESFGAYAIGHDPGLMKSITSANIAAGFHAGDPSVLRSTVRRAKAHGVAVGAHPSFPDLAGFGRREMKMSGQEVEDLVLYQIAAVAGVAQVEGVALQHVKPHGALYNMAARDRRLSDTIVRAVLSFDSSLVLFGLAGSVMLAAGRDAGLRVAAEGFADRMYEPDGSLTPRSRPGAVLDDPAAVASRAVRMIRDGIVSASDGREVRVHIDTICVHGDTPGAEVSARALRTGLTEAGIAVRAVGAAS